MFMAATTRQGRDKNVIRFCSTLYSAQNVLSIENMNKTIAKFQNTKPIRLQTHEPAKRAAVLIPLCVVNKKVSLLYTLRAPHLKLHRGQVSFPGGMQESKDQDLVETALRETREELGISEEQIDVWGIGSLIITRTEMSVLPVIGRIKGQLFLDQFNINQQEVEEVYTVALEDLCNPEKVGHTQFRSAYSTPVYLGGPRRIWGLTGLITNVFLSCLLPPQAYTHKIKYIPHVSTVTHL